METLRYKTVGRIVSRTVFQLLPFIFSLYLLFPNLAIAKDMTNIILPNGQKPTPRLLSTNYGDYISVSELRKVFLPNFARTNSNQLSDKNGREIIIIAGAMFISSTIADGTYIAQISKPAINSSQFNSTPDIYLPYSDIPSLLVTLNIYDLITIGEITALKEKELISIPEIPEFEISDNAINKISEDSDSDYIVTETAEDISETTTEYTPSPIVSMNVFTKGKTNNVNSAGADETEYSILPTAISVINNTRNAFLALKPKSEKILYLEPNIIKAHKPQNPNSNDIVPSKDESMPPNVFVVPKGLFRRGIDDK